VETRVLRNRAIRALLAAEVISTTGGQMTWVALPWFVLVTTGSATRMSIVLAAEAVGLAAFGFPSARLLNRLGARRTMLLCDGLRGPLMLVVPVLHWADALSFGLLIAVALALGAFSAPYYSANRMILPELLGEDETVVSQASALFQGATRITLLLGPVTAGVLIGRSERRRSCLSTPRPISWRSSWSRSSCRRRSRWRLTARIAAFSPAFAGSRASR
jgi:MFS family permease